jgi:hypothetical protein
MRGASGTTLRASSAVTKWPLRPSWPGDMQWYFPPFAPLNKRYWDRLRYPFDGLAVRYSLDQRRQSPQFAVELVFAITRQESAFYE